MFGLAIGSGGDPTRVLLYLAFMHLSVLVIPWCIHLQCFWLVLGQELVLQVVPNRLAEGIGRESI